MIPECLIWKVKCKEEDRPNGILKSFSKSGVISTSLCWTETAEQLSWLVLFSTWWQQVEQRRQKDNLKRNISSQNRNVKTKNELKQDELLLATQKR